MIHTFKIPGFEIFIRKKKNSNVGMKIYFSESLVV